jgi:hypothetical protein
MIRVIAILLFGSILAGPLAAQTTDVPSRILLANEPVNGRILFHERLLEAARISGAVVAGLQVRRPARSVVDLKVHVPEEWLGKKICARVVSADGLYEAVNTYTIPEGLRGGIAMASLEGVPFDTAYGQRLSEAESDGLAIRVTLGDCESGAPRDATVAYWNADDAGQVTLLVNSFRASRVFVYIGDGTASPVACEAVALPARTAYDTKCALEALPVGEHVKLTVFRVRDNGSTASDEILLHTPTRSAK